MKHFTILAFTFFFVSFSLPTTSNSSYEREAELTKENLVKTMVDSGIQHVDIVLAQAILESGNFKSVVFKTKNNMFGMKMPRKRETTAINERGYTGYATYKNWVDCVRDYKLYQDYVTKNKNVSKSKYLSIIAKSYSETEDYVEKLHKIMSQNKKYT